MRIGIIRREMHGRAIPEDIADKDHCKEREEGTHHLQPEHVACPGEGSQERFAGASHFARDSFFMRCISGVGLHYSLQWGLGRYTLLRGLYGLPGSGWGKVWIGRSSSVYGLVEPPGGGAGALAEYATETDRIHPQSLQERPFFTPCRQGESRKDRLLHPTPTAAPSSRT
jgi:hypothetical protein